jgi:hypothetical protein
MVESAALPDGLTHRNKIIDAGTDLPRSLYRDLSSCTPSNRTNSMVLIGLAASSSALTPPHCCATSSPVG